MVDYSSDFIQQSLKIYDPPGLWDSTPTDRFPDPTTQLDAFLHYCNHSREHLTAFLYLITPEMVEGGDVRPLITHGPFVYSKLYVNLNSTICKERISNIASFRSWHVIMRREPGNEAIYSELC